MAVARLRNTDPFTPKHLGTFRLFCLHGENDGLIRERIAELRTAFAGSGSPPTVTEIGGDGLAAEPFALADAIGSPSLFATRQFVLVTLGTRAAAKPLANALPALAQATDTLIVVDGGADKRQEDAIALLSGHPACLVVSCPPDRADDLADHAQAVLSAAGIALDRPGAQELVDLADGDRALLGNELAKLLLAFEKGATVDAGSLRAIVADETGVFLDEVAARILAGDVRAALDATDRLADAGVDPAQLASATLRKAFWEHRKSSGTRAADVRRVIARLQEAVRASRSNDRLAASRAELALIRSAQFLRR